MGIFRDLGFPSVILVNKPLKALCLSIKMVYQHLLYIAQSQLFVRICQNKIYLGTV